MAELYTWRVLYGDGSYTEEYDESRPDGRGFAEIGEKPVKAIMLVPGGQSVVIPDGAAPVFFRRRYIAMTPESDGSVSETVHCIGWTGVYLFVFDNGRTLLTSDLQAV